MLASCDRSTPVGERDYAILLILARLGLRAGEVVALTLDDLDWERGEILVRGKGQRLGRLPLPTDVGAALVDYLRHVRPRCSTRPVFNPHASAVARPGRSHRHRLCRSSRAQARRTEPGVQGSTPATPLARHRSAASRRFPH